MILRLLCSRDHHKWVTLQKGPEADERYSEIDVLLSFDVKWLLTLYAEPDRTMFVRDMGSHTARPEEAILIDDDTALNDAHDQKQPSWDVQVTAGKGLVGWQVSSDGIDGERCQSMVCTEEQFIGGSAEEREGEQKDAAQRWHTLFGVSSECRQEGHKLTITANKFRGRSRAKDGREATATSTWKMGAEPPSRLLTDESAETCWGSHLADLQECWGEDRQTVGSGW